MQKQPNRSYIAFELNLVVRQLSDACVFDADLHTVGNSYKIGEIMILSIEHIRTFPTNHRSKRGGFMIAQKAGPIPKFLSYRV